MNKKLIAWSALLLIFLLAMNIILIMHYRQGNKETRNPMIVGSVIEAVPLTSPEEVSIDKKDMKACCTFEREGIEHTCYVLERFSCDHCIPTCTQ